MGSFFWLTAIVAITGILIYGFGRASRDAGKSQQAADAERAARDAEIEMTDAVLTQKTTGEVIDDMRKGKF